MNVQLTFWRFNPGSILTILHGCAVGTRGKALFAASALLGLVSACGGGEDRTDALRLNPPKAQLSSAQVTAISKPLTRDLHGQLPREVELLLTRLPERHPHGTVLVFIRAADTFTCEDLGRQVRELQHASAARPRSFLIATEPADTEQVIGWLQRERIRYDRLILTAPRVVLTSGDTIATPAVLLIDEGGRFERGVAHPQRVNNTRSMSFAAELGFM